eukprot:gene11315-21505_t
MANKGFRCTFLLLCWACWLAIGSKCPEKTFESHRRSVTGTTYDSKYISSNTRSLTVASFLQCIQKCLAACLCYYANYKMQENRSVLCELVKYPSCSVKSGVLITDATGWTAVKLREEIKTLEGLKNCCPPRVSSAAYKIGAEGESCGAVCAKLGKICSPHLLTLNSVYHFHRLGVSCEYNKNAADCFHSKVEPAYLPGTGVCGGFINVPLYYDCATGAQPGLRRLCRTGAEKASNEVARSRWAFIGHTLRHQGPAREAMEKYELVRNEKARSKGRPVNNIAMVVTADKRKRRCTMEDAEDRARWKAAIEEDPRRSGRNR